MTSLRQDLRFALGTARRGRIAGILAIASLALGVAGNAVVFGTMDALLFRPLPYPEADRLVLLGEREKDRPAIVLVSLTSAYASWAEYQERTRTLDTWAALSPTFFSLGGGGQTVPVTGAYVTPDFLPLLGATTVRGRLPTPEESRPGGPRVAVVRAEYWARNAAVEDPIGAMLTLNGQPYEVVGVLREGFEFLVPGIEIWVPLQEDPRSPLATRHTVISVARMAPGVTMGAVKAEVAAVARRIEEEHPATRRGWTADALNLRHEFPDPHSRRYMAVLQVAVFLVLLIACANIVNLLLARSQERRREIALRTALGADRLRILRQLLRESLWIAAIGGVLGLGMAAIGIRFVAASFGRVLAGNFSPALDLRVLTFIAGTTLLCGLVFGLMPAIQTLRTNQLEALRQGPGGGAGGKLHRRVGSGLVAAEIALCFVALAGGVALVRGFLSERDSPPGFRAERLLTIQFTVPHWKYDEDGSAALLDRLLQRAGELPELESVALINTLPQNLLPPRDTFRVPGAPIDPGAAAPRAVLLSAAPGYLRTFGVPLQEGRFFEAGDRTGALPVVVVSRALAERRFPDGAVGRHVQFQGAVREVVGVAGNVQQSLVQHAAGEEAIYVPLAQVTPRRLFLVARTRREPLAAAGALSAVIREADADIAINAVETMSAYGRRYLVGIDIFNAILLVFGVFALLLAALGTYGVVAYAVAQRSHEIGVRMAVGATPGRVVRLFAWQGLRLALLGLAAGAVVLLPVLALVGSVLSGFGLAPLGASVILAVALLLLAVTIGASALPASRAAAVDPVRVLRAE
jgi:putative ABC transport system permease protein